VHSVFWCEKLLEIGHLKSLRRKSKSGVKMDLDKIGCKDVIGIL
jgi:hypothetical protein